MMTHRTYDQYCAIASALDIIGDRWTLLVVRNLLLGPKRFVDLMRGLPGISTNLLTERLRLLEAQGIAQTRYLPPPAASTVYELTETGQALTDILSALARWGSLALSEPRPNQKITDEGIGFMVLGVFHRPDAPSDLWCDLHVNDARYDRHFEVRMSAHGITLNEGANNAPVTLTIPLEPLLRLSSGRATLAALLSSGAAMLAGEPTATAALIAWLK
jgi:DNA-binding HxlR family transcriptional regulator